MTPPPGAGRALVSKLSQNIRLPGFYGTIGELLRQELKKAGQPGLGDFPSILIKYLTISEEEAFDDSEVPPNTLCIILPKELQKYLDGHQQEGEVVEWWPKD